MIDGKNEDNNEDNFVEYRNSKFEDMNFTILNGGLKPAIVLIIIITRLQR